MRRKTILQIAIAALVAAVSIVATVTPAQAAVGDGGRWRNTATGLCIEAGLFQGNGVYTAGCNVNNVAQLWQTQQVTGGYRFEQDLATGWDQCLSANTSNVVFKWTCGQPPPGASQTWTLLYVSYGLMFRSALGTCLEGTSGGGARMRPCNTYNRYQAWNPW